MYKLSKIIQRFKLCMLQLELKYYIFNYNRFFRWGVESPYYKSKINETKKEMKKINRER